MLAGDWNQLSLVQAVLQDCKTESSLLSGYVYTGDTRWSKYAVLLVFTPVVF